MYCKNCGHQIDDNCKYCPDCGAPQPTSFSSDYQYTNPEEIKNDHGYNSVCIIGFVISCVSLFFNLFGLLAIAGIIVSIAGLKSCKNREEKGKVFAVIGIILGMVSLIYIIFITLFLFGFASNMTQMTGFSIL